MSVSIFISELLFTIIIAIAILVVWQLIRSKNGMFRKIMIGYFAVEIYMFSFIAIYWWYEDQGRPFISLELFRLFTLVPKVVIKLWLLWWLVKQNRKQK